MSTDVTYVYTRRLKGGCVYVGKTIDPTSRRLWHELKPPRWVERHGLEVDNGELLVVGQTTRDAASGLESLWTARLMWAIGVNKVRGGDKCDWEDYTTTDIGHLAQFLRHYLNNVSFEEIDKRLSRELMAGDGALYGVHLCRLCKEARPFRGALCPSCYFKASVCGKCGVKGHVERWCARFGPAVDDSSTFAAVASRSAAKPSSPVAMFEDMDENLLIQFLDRSQTAFEEEYRNSQDVRETTAPSGPGSGALFPICLDCNQRVTAGRPRCYPCWLSKTPCFFCMEVGHMHRDCARRVPTPGPKRKSLF
jgi:hypothetical protein